MPYRPLVDLEKLRDLINAALVFLGGFTDPTDPHYGLSTSRPDLVHALNGVDKAITQAGITDSTLSVLPILAGLNFNDFFPANLLNAETTIAIRLSLVKGGAFEATWRQGWHQVHGVVDCFRHIINECYNDLT